MTPDRWRQIEAIFHQALEVTPSERTSFLNAACGSDTELRSEVDEMLSHDAGDDIGHIVAQAAVGLPTPDIGSTIGVWHLVRELGNGGMGTVFLAVRLEGGFFHTAALKLVRRGMDTAYVLARFRHERQILANLQHPNIASLLDGGETSNGRPYFVMEYVEGEPITDYCNRHELSTTERIELFRAVCSAVHHAHQKLVIHRDIKPSNILVTADGVPKLLDFGIARLLAPELVPGEAPRTETSVRVMTPDYASPEQIRGEPLTTATDVYSLGVLLFELLAGVRPYRLSAESTVGDLERAICTEDPPKPSHSAVAPSLRRELAGDLDNIVLMTLRKDPVRRYNSAEQLSEDLFRFGRDLPVLARQDTIHYRVSRFIKRNRAAAAAIVVVAISLIGATVVSAYQARRAERRFAQVRRLANVFLFDVHDRIEHLPGSTEARELLVRTALEYLDSLAAEAGNDSGLQAELAAAYERVGDVQGSPQGPNLGHSAAALRSYRKALLLRERLSVAQSGDRKFALALSGNYQKVGMLEARTGKLADAIPMYRKGLVMAEGLDGPAEFAFIGSGYHNLSDAFAAMGNMAEALTGYRRALEAHAAWAKRDAGEQPKFSLATSYVRIGRTMKILGDLQSAKENFARAIEIREGIARRTPDFPRNRRELIVANNYMGEVLGHPLFANLGDTAGALKFQRRAMAVAEELSAADARNALAKYDFAMCHWNVGTTLWNIDPKESAVILRQGLQLFDELAAGAPENLNYRRMQGLVRVSLGHALANDHNDRGALEELGHALTIQKQIASRDTANNNPQEDMLVTYREMGDVQLAGRRFDDALKSYQQSAAIAVKVDASASSGTSRRDVADAYGRLARLYNAMGRNDEAQVWNQKRAAVQ